MVMFAIGSAVVARFVTVADLIALAMPIPTVPRFSVLALTRTAVPVPDRATVWGLVGSESLIVKVALRVPAAVGLKVTLMVQLAPPASDDPQLLVSLKSPAF